MLAYLDRARLFCPLRRLPVSNGVLYWYFVDVV